MPKRREGPGKDKTTIENHNYFEDFWTHFRTQHEGMVLNFLY